MQCFLTWPATSNKVREPTGALLLSETYEALPPSDRLFICAGGIARQHHQLVSRQVLISADWWQDGLHCAGVQPCLAFQEHCITMLCHRQYGAPLVGVFMTEDGQCFDEMNRNVWQASACTACDAVSAKVPLNNIWRRIMMWRHVSYLAGHIQCDHEQSSSVKTKISPPATSLGYAKQ